MVIELSALGLAIIGVAVSVVPNVMQTLGYLGRKSEYRTLQKSFEDVSSRLTEVLQAELRDPAMTQDRVFSLLDIGDVILPQVQRRVRRRFFFLLSVALGSGAGMWVAAEALADSQAAAVAGGLVLVNWGAAFSGFLNEHLLTKQEREFLTNVGLLQDRFYRDVVTDSVVKFNRRCERLLATDLEAFQREWASLASAFRKSLPPSEEKEVPHDGGEGRGGRAESRLPWGSDSPDDSRRA